MKPNKTRFAISVTVALFAIALRLFTGSTPDWMAGMLAGVLLLNGFMWAEEATVSITHVQHNTELVKREEPKRKK